MRGNEEPSLPRIFYANNQKSEGRGGSLSKI